MAKDKSALDEHGTECAAQKNVEGLVQSENLAFVRTGLCHEKVGHGRLSLSEARCDLQPFSMLIRTQFNGNWQRTTRAWEMQYNVSEWGGRQSRNGANHDRFRLFCLW